MSGREREKDRDKKRSELEGNTCWLKKKLQDENRTEEEVKNETLDGREGE